MELTECATGDDAVTTRSPLVSIGIPTFNRCESLQTTLASILSQEYANLEIVISDNASTDGTQLLCEQFTGRDSRIKYIRQPINGGMIRNFREVLERATGEFFMWISDDDSLHPLYVRRCLRVLMAHPGTTLVCGVPTFRESVNGSFEGVSVNLLQPTASERVEGFYSQVNDNGTFYGLARREILLANPLPPVLGGDWLMIASLACLGNIVTVPDVAVYRSSRGASADVRSLALHFGLSKMKARQPHISIAINVAEDIAFRSPAYRSLGLPQRWLLALRCALIVHRRFVKFENPVKNFASRARNKAHRLLRAR